MIFPLDKDGFIYLLFNSLLTSSVSLRSLHEGDRERKRNDSEVAVKTAQRVVKPKATEMDATGEFPRELLDTLGKQGLLSVLLPEEFGGTNGDVFSFCLVIEEIAKVCGSSSLILLAQGAGTMPILIGGDASQQERYFNQIAEKNSLTALAMETWMWLPAWVRSKWKPRSKEGIIFSVAEGFRHPRECGRSLFCFCRVEHRFGSEGFFCLCRGEGNSRTSLWEARRDDRDEGSGHYGGPLRQLSDSARESIGR